MSPPVTRIGRSTPTDVYLRDRSVPHELMGQVTFTDALFLAIVGELPSPAQRAVVDASLVSLLDHGLTPSAIATRLTFGGAPESVQGAVAAGLLGVGSRFAGTMEACGALLARVTGAADPRLEAERVVAEHRAARASLPGFGHPQHKPEDPRAVRLFALAREHGLAGPRVAALHQLSEALDAALGRHVPINATGAIAAVLADAGVPPEIHRGFAVIARSAGLVAHVREEQLDPASDALWHGAERAVEPGS